MFKNKSLSGKNNISGENIAKCRKDKMQLEGIELDKNAIQRIESGQRFVTDIEIRGFSKVLRVSYDRLLDQE